MDVFDAITQHLAALAMAIGVDPQDAKRFAYAHGLSSLWDLVRDLYLSSYLMLVVPLWLVLGRLRPAEQTAGMRKRPHLSLDFIYPLFCLPVTVTVVAGGVALINEAVKKYLPSLATGLLDDQPIAVQAIGAFLITDLMFYVAHVLKHKVRWLWYFHAVHHSQRYVNPLTTLRNHPLETITNAVIKTVPIAIVGGTYPAWALFAFFNNMWGYYIHADLRTNMGPLKYILVSPQNHRLHHTIEPDLIDRNFGERLTVWDWLFGTLHTDFDTYTATGAKGCEAIEERSAAPFGLLMAWLRQFLFPFRMIGADVRRYLQARRVLRA